MSTAHVLMFEFGSAMFFARTPDDQASATLGANMKIILTAALVLAASPAFAQYYGGYGTGSNSRSHYVQPHSRSDGSMGGGYYRTNPNNTTLDNYGTRGNYNPYTGQTGRRGSSLY